MSMMTIELRKEARHQSTCIHIVTYCKTRWVRSRSPIMLSIHYSVSYYCYEVMIKVKRNCLDVSCGTAQQDFIA